MHRVSTMTKISLMLRAIAHMLSLGADLVSLAPGFNPVTHKMPIFISSAALARRRG